jgi:hypothetical protein
MSEVDREINLTAGFKVLSVIGNIATLYRHTMSCLAEMWLPNRGVALTFEQSQPTVHGADDTVQVFQ